MFGMAGFAKDVDWLIDEIFRANQNDYRPDYFVAEDTNPHIGELLNGKRIIAEREFFSEHSKNQCNCFVAVGSPIIRTKIVSKLKSSGIDVAFPNLIHPDVTFDRRAEKLILGEGNIFCSKSTLSSDVRIGNFVHLNLDCTVGHDAIIGNYCTFSPGTHLSGNVIIEDHVFVGTGAVVLENTRICAQAVIGAGAVVVKNIQVPGTYVGMPAKLMAKP